MVSGNKRNPRVEVLQGLCARDHSPCARGPMRTVQGRAHWVLPIHCSLLARRGGMGEAGLCRYQQQPDISHADQWRTKKTPNRNPRKIGKKSRDLLPKDMEARDTTAGGPRWPEPDGGGSDQGSGNAKGGDDGEF